jgi:hypothetical protein
MGTNLEAESRRKLAVAIAKLDAAERDLQVAVDAKYAASEKQDEAQERLDALRNPSDGDEQPELGAVFAASLRAGAPCDAAVLERPMLERRDAIEAAQRDVDIWTKTYESCKAIIPAKQSAIDNKRRAVDQASIEVVRNAGVIEPLLAGLAELEAQLLERRLVLYFLESRDLIPEKDKRAVMRAQELTELPGSAYGVSRTKWREHPTFIALLNAFEALKRDANAPLPLPIAVTR